LYRFDVCAGHGKNVRCLVNKRSSQRLAAEIANICAVLRTNFYCVHARRLTTDRVYAGGCDFEIFSVTGQTAEKAFGDRAPTNIACADKEDAFHGLQHAASAFSKLEANLSKSIFAGRQASFRQ
jgi:hypothetical protein